MIRELRLMAYFLVGLLLGGWVVVASAETVPALKALVSSNFYYCVPNQAIRSWSEVPAIACPEIIAGSQYYQGKCWNAAGTTPLCTLQGAQDFRYSCPTGQNWTVSGITCTRPECVLPDTRDPADGVCKVVPVVCTGNQTRDAATNTCVCGTTQPTTISYQVGAGAGKDAPACNGGCTMSSGGAWGSPVIACHYNLSGMFNPKTLSSTCYARSGQTGTTCSSAGSGNGLPIQVTLQPAAAPGAVAGINQNGEADPFSTKDNNSDPISCANSGGNYGVFNGSGNCYKPTATDPVITVKESVAKINDAASGKETTTTTTVTQTCTGIGSCTSTTSTATSSGGVVKGASTTTGTGSGASLTKTGDGSYKLDLPTDYQRDATGLSLNAKMDDYLERIGKTTTDDAPITEATHSAESKQQLKDEDKKFTDAATGEVDPIVSQKSAWKTAMETGWFDPIPSSTCTGFNTTFAGHVWSMDHCPIAKQISDWGAYGLYVMTAFGVFVFVTGGNKETA